MSKNDILKEAFEWFRYEGIIKTQKEFASLIGITESNMSRALKGDEKYLTDNLISKVNALMKYHKEEQGISINHSPNTNVATGQGQINISTPIPNLQPQPSPEDNMVPVIPLNLYKESDVNILEYINDDDNNVQTTPAVQQFPKTDAIYSVQTMAMYPHLHQGDLLALKAIKKSTSIVNGEMYAIDTIDNGIIVRFAYDRGDYLELKASERADRFESFTINKKDIYTIFRVVGMIRTNI